MCGSRRVKLSHAYGFFLACWLAIGFVFAAHAANPIAIVGATLIHPDRETIAQDQTLIIEGNRISAIGPSAEIVPPPEAQLIDARGKWVMPGLIDSHVHFFQSANFFTRPDVADFRSHVGFAEETVRNKARLPVTFKVTLANGVTSVVDVGGPLWNFDVREAARNSPAAPRVAVAGPLVSMIASPELESDDSPILQAKTPDEARALVARQVPYKPDYIKVWFIHRRGDDLAAQERIVAAAGEAAHAEGIRFAVHATELEVAKAALRAGADLLVHSVEDRPIDDEFISLARARNVLYCPTLFVYRGYERALSGEWQASAIEKARADPEIVRTLTNNDVLPKSLFPHWVSLFIGNQWLPRRAPVMAANLRKAWDAGITVVMGTDAGNIGTLHGTSIHQEMALMAEAGLTPMQILRAATVNGAKVLGMQNELGALAVGQLADVLILDADPLQDLANLARLHRVVKDGVIYDPAELMRSIAP